MAFEEICYANNYIKAVILKIDCAAFTRELNKSAIESIMNILPFYEKRIEQQVQVKVQMNPQQQNASSSSSSEEATSHVFLDKSRSFTMTISELLKAIWFETTKYENWEIFKDSVTQLLDILVSNMNLETTNSCGLRYINQLPLKTFSEVNKYFQKPIYTIFKDCSSDKTLSRLFIIKQQTFPDHMIKFQFGVPNQYFPNPILLPEFVIDIDAYSQTNCDINAIKDKIEIYHTSIQKLFEESISDKLRKVMGIKQDGK